MRVLAILALALMLAFSTAAGAADRPVGPETGQARIAEDSGGFVGLDHPDDGENSFGAFETEPSEIGLTFAGWFRALARMFNCGIRMQAC